MGASMPLLLGLCGICDRRVSEELGRLVEWWKWHTAILDGQKATILWDTQLCSAIKQFRLFKIAGLQPCTQTSSWLNILTIVRNRSHKALWTITHDKIRYRGFSHYHAVLCKPRVWICFTMDMFTRLWQNSWTWLWAYIGGSTVSILLHCMRGIHFCEYIHDLAKGYHAGSTTRKKMEQLCGLISDGKMDCICSNVG